MESQVKRGGNSEQYGLDCPGNKTYFLCGNLTKISPGDQVQAAVAFLGPYIRKPAVRKFEIRLTDVTTGKYADGGIKTNKLVRIRNIARQGGAIVENSPACHLKDFFSCGIPAHNGLAHFTSPIPIWNVFTLGGKGSSASLHYNEWVMKRDGHRLASNGRLAIVNDGMSYNISWLRRH